MKEKEKKLKKLQEKKEANFKAKRLVEKVKKGEKLVSLIYNLL